MLEAFIATICVCCEITSDAIRGYLANDAGASASSAYVALTRRGDGAWRNWSTYLAGSSYLWLREFPASRLVITAVVIGPEMAVALVQLRRPAIFRPMPLKPGDSPRYIRYLPPLLYPRLLRKNSGYPRNSPRRSDVRFAGNSPSRFMVFARSHQCQIYRWEADVMLALRG